MCEWKKRAELVKEWVRSWVGGWVDRWVETELCQETGRLEVSPQRKLDSSWLTDTQEQNDQHSFPWRHQRDDMQPSIKNGSQPTNVLCSASLPLRYKWFTQRQSKFVPEAKHACTDRHQEHISLMPTMLPGPACCLEILGFFLPWAQRNNKIFLNIILNLQKLSDFSKP